MPEITLNIAEDVFIRIPDSIKKEDSFSELAGSALTEWINWLDGSWRPMSISEIEANRIYRFYAKVLPEVIPSADHIGEYFNLPLGRARYIMQVLNYRHGAFIRERQISHLVHALEEAQYSPDDETYTIRVDHSVKKIIDDTIRALIVEDRIQTGLSGRVALDYIRYDMGRGHRKNLLEVFREDLDTLRNKED